MGIIAWIVFGLIAGVIAKIAYAGARDGGGFILTCILGIVGAGRWRMAGDDVWYWRPVSAALICTVSWSAVVGANRGAGDFSAFCDAANRCRTCKR
ncbi:transglycosylase associated protein [Salmonella enterica subsp. enterica]|uniref:Transglycosylase associated protein n=1 Tax=Salmonella enterica I TaxID=59201 RepID=A0A3S4LXM6_SALET|nr:transglycosylase associated protein [Salmonella enterica subsp. enterica]